MNPYAPSNTTTPAASTLAVAIGMLTIGIIGLGSFAAVHCGISCYRDMGADNVDEVMTIMFTFAVTLLLLVFIGIPAGMIHLRQRSKLGHIPFAAYVVAIAALLVASLLGNPHNRWFSIFLVCSMWSRIGLHLNISLRPTNNHAMHPSREVGRFDNGKSLVAIE